jgi:hypothetical protein
VPELASNALETHETCWLVDPRAYTGIACLETERVKSFFQPGSTSFLPVVLRS